MASLWPSAFVSSLLARSVLLPALTTASVVALSRVWSRRSGGVAGLAAFAAYAGFIAAYAALYPNLSFPPRSVLAWLPWLTLGGAAIAQVADRAPPPAGLAGRLLAAAIASFVLLAPILRQESVGSGLLQAGVVTGLWWLLWITVARPARDDGTGALSLTLTAAGLALAAPLSGSLLLAELGGSLASALASAWAWSRVTGTSGRGARDLAVLLLGALLVDLRFYAEASLIVVLGLIAIPFVGLATGGLIRRWVSGRPAAVILASGLGALVPLGVALWQAFRVYQASAGGYG